MNDTESHWNLHEMRRAASIISAAKKKRNIAMRILDETIHWIVLLVAFIGNTLIGATLLGLSILLPPAMIYLLSLVAGVSFGFLLEGPLFEIRRLDSHKIFLLQGALIVLALMNIYILIGISALIGFYTGFVGSANVLLSGCIYGISFFLPRAALGLRKS